MAEIWFNQENPHLLLFLEYDEINGDLNFAVTWHCSVSGYISTGKSSLGVKMVFHFLKGSVEKKQPIENSVESGSKGIYG